MATGTVKWFSTQKGFGFIAPDGGGNDAFVHISAVERAGLADLHEGQKVGFDLVADRDNLGANLRQSRICCPGHRYRGNQDSQQRDECENVLGSDHMNGVCP